MAKKRVHRIPHQEVRKVLVRHGIASVNRAIEWGGSQGKLYPLVSAKSVEGILRGKRTLGVEFDRVDQIVSALGSPEAWYTDLAAWYYPPGVKPEAEYETFLPQARAFDMAQALFAGEDGALSFS